ncbi:MAG: hypothetical protein KAS32_07695 [Candidatus Peribacteraceae bacterium]|nr:hypothetical protein [Candidatus Peribacteraceae bacterium]
MRMERGGIISCGTCGKVPIYKWGLCEGCFLEWEELSQIVEMNRKLVKKREKVNDKT